MRLPVFGETNRTKHYLVKRALDAGYSVSVLEGAENTARKRKNLRVIKGDIRNKQSIQRVMQGADAVLCLLQNPRRTLDDASRSIVENLISCMEENAVRRLVIFSFVHNDTPSKQAVSGNIFKRFLSLFTGRYDEPSGVEDILRHTGIDWTIIGHPPASNTLSEDIAESKANPEQFRTELAKHMVGQITDVAYIRDTLLLPAQEVS